MSYPNYRGLERIVAPVTEPLTLAEAKLYCRIDGSVEDALLVDLIRVAREQAEAYLKMSLLTQSWKLNIDHFDAEIIYLPIGPVQSITSVTAVSNTLGSSSISAATYRLNAAKDQLFFDPPPRTDRLEVVYVTGYNNASVIPAPIRYGMLNHVVTLYESRGQSPEIPDSALKLYLPFRGVRL